MTDYDRCLVQHSKVRAHPSAVFLFDCDSDAVLKVILSSASFIPLAAMALGNIKMLLERPELDMVSSINIFSLFVFLIAFVASLAVSLITF